MTVFGAYSSYYDLLYRDKNYEREVDFVLGALRSATPRLASLLELGSGTGKHAALFAKAGIAVEGVDLSKEMLDQAERRKAALPAEIADRLRFAEGDVRHYHSERRFDAVVSLFHVVSYQQTNDDLRAMFETAASHLESGGIFFFDFWYGPAVLTQRPAVAVKRMESETVSVVRVAQPVLRTEESIVDVNYHIMVREKASGRVEDIFETHRMRYLFLTEIEFLAHKAGFKVGRASGWLTTDAAGPETWGVCVALTK